MRRHLLAALSSLAIAACAHPAPAPAPIAPLALPPTASAPAEPSARTPAPAPPPPQQHWYFESLSSDGKRALLRELDPRTSTTLHVRSVDVETSATIDDVTLPELAKVPVATIGEDPRRLAALEWMLASGAFARDIARGAKLVRSFPFGEGGRIAAAATGSAIAFDAGDWLYVADETGRVRRRIVEEAAYDPRFLPDGKTILFRRAVTAPSGNTAYELFAVPSDLSGAPRAIPNTSGMRDRFVLTPDGRAAVAIASPPRGIRGATETCILSLALQAPFPVKRLACIDGSEQLVEHVISPRGKWAAVSTKRRSEGRGLEWRLRVVSLASGKTTLDEADLPGLGIRAISDSGLLVQSGVLGVVVRDVPGKTSRQLDLPSLGHRGFFRNDGELVFLDGGSVRVLDVSR